jgi:hypothetical protein
MASLVYNKNNPQLLQDEDAGQTVKYHSSDSEELYNKSVADNWRWKDVNIDYTFNSLGYRTKELAELDKDFLLTFGCSYTEGIGLPNKSIWPTRLAKELNLDLYNAGKAGSGLDICYYNALLWKQHKLPLPTRVVLQLPEPTRKSWGTTEDSGIRLDVSNGRQDDWWKHYLTSNGEMNINNIAWYLGFNNIWQALGVPVLNITWSPFPHLENLEFPLHYANIKSDDSLLARDNMHSGPEWHINITKRCKELLCQ